MYIFASIDMPEIFKKRMPFKNSTEFDSPLYESSLAVFQTTTSIENGLKITLNDLEFVGFNPFVNTKCSNTSPHKVLRGKSFRPGLYIGVTQLFKPEKSWRHKAIHLCNTELINSVKFVLRRNVIVTVPKSSVIISKGMCRALPTDFINPVWKNKYMSGCLIHRGPKKNNATYNMSLGCVTVEEQNFDGMMKFVEFDEVVLYVHHIDQLVNDKDNECFKKLEGFDYTFCKIMYDNICSNITVMAGK